MKKLFSIITGLLLMFGIVSPTFAVGPTIKFAQGNVRYTASGVQRNATFNVANFAQDCTVGWDVTGAYVVAFELNDNPTQYAHDMNLTQTGSSVSGDGGYLAGTSPYSFAWDITGGTVTGNSITLDSLYDVGAPGVIMNMTGTIASDGTMSGDWTDDYGGGTRNGTWATTSGEAVQTVSSGCAGAGMFNYHDANKNHYLVDVKYVNVSGNKVWFAGPVKLGNIGAGMWLFAEAEDVANPFGATKDKIWGSFTTEAAAKLGVATMANPTDGPFVISQGNLRVN